MEFKIDYYLIYPVLAYVEVCLASRKPKEAKESCIAVSWERVIAVHVTHDAFFF